MIVRGYQTEKYKTNKQTKTQLGKLYWNWIKTNNKEKFFFFFFYKEKFIKGAIEIGKIKIMHRKIKIKIIAENMQTRKQLSDIFRLLKENNY